MENSVWWFPKKLKTELSYCRPEDIYKPHISQGAIFRMYKNSQNWTIRKQIIQSISRKAFEQMLSQIEYVYKMYKIMIR